LVVVAVFGLAFTYRVIRAANGSGTGEGGPPKAMSRSGPSWMRSSMVSLEIRVTDWA
jgi:hypothetical protein